MAKNKTYVPSGMAGLQRFSEDEGRFKIKPGHVIFLILIIAAIVLFLHFQGNAIFGIQ